MPPATFSLFLAPAEIFFPASIRDVLRRRKMTEGLKGREVTSKVGNKSCRKNYRGKKVFERRRWCRRVVEGTGEG